MHWFSLDYSLFAKFHIRCYRVYKLVRITTIISKYIPVRCFKTATEFLYTNHESITDKILFEFLLSLLSVCTLATNEQRCDPIVPKAVYTQVCRRSRCFHNTDRLFCLDELELPVWSLSLVVWWFYNGIGHHTTVVILSPPNERKSFLEQEDSISGWPGLVCFALVSGFYWY